MTRTMALSVAVAAGLMLAPAAASAQGHGDKVSQAAGNAGGDSGGGSRGGSSGGSSGGDSSSSGGSHGSSAGSSSSGGNHGTAVTRADSGSVASNRGHERGNRPANGQAVRRDPGHGGGGGDIIVLPPGGGYWGGYYPWGWGGLGLGGYYAGFYDPWYDAYPGYGGGYSSDGYEGSLRLKVKPRQAEVYVDGYYAGQVDDFDGTFQSLKMESGPHRIEVRGEGFEPLFFEIRIQPDRTVTYTGTLKKQPE